MTNIFDYPQYYRNELLKYKYFDTDVVPKRYKGKSLMYAFLTRYCSVGCSFCFNRSLPPSVNPEISDQFSDVGIEKLIKFCEKANLGCLIISGGGDPLFVKEHLLRLVEFAQADRIVLVTSGFWAKDYASAKKIIDEIYESFKRRKKPTQLVLRISISSYHAKTLGVEPALNVISIFDEYYKEENNFRTQLKTFNDDEAFELFLKRLDYGKISDCEENVSDNFIVEKILRKKRTLTLKSGLEIIIGISEVFYTSVLPDLSDKDSLSHVVKTVDDDLLYSVRQFPSTILNTDGSVGLNWSLYYNGNICLWQSQARDTYQSIYEDDYDHVIASHFSDPLVYSFVDKGSIYRDSIVNEVSPLAIFRSKSTGLRDRLGLYLLDDERVRLYYMVRSIQDYIKEGVISSNCLSKNIELYELVNQPVTCLIQLFKDSTFDPLAQEICKPFNESTFYDFLGLVKLKHFDLDQWRVKEAVEWYNQNTKNTKLESIDDVKVQEDSDTYKRIGNRQMSIKDSLVAYKNL